MKEAKDFNLAKAFECEQKIAFIHAEQIAHGVVFDIRRAHWYIHILNERLLGYYHSIQQYLKPTISSPNEGKATVPFKKDGSYSHHAVQWYGTDVGLVSGSFCKITIEGTEELLTKRERLGKQLIELGWKPKHYTATGIPQLIINKEPCESLAQFGILGDTIAKYYTYTHRRNQIQGFFKHAWYDADGSCRLSADANIIGTPTFRYTHRIVANIPKASKHVLFGKEMRSLFTIPKGYKLVGSDASGIETRVLSSYINDPDYTETVVNGDIHSLHQEMAGLPTRDNAKSFFYCFLYGGGNAKIGEVVGGSSKRGGQLKKQFLAANPNLSKLIKAVQADAASGFLTGLDGRRITMRKVNGEVQVHKALNTLLQSGASVVMKYSDIWLCEQVKALGLNAHQVISYHDEVQFEVADADVPAFVELCNHWVRVAGELLGLNCPLASDAQVGRNWSETH